MNCPQTRQRPAGTGREVEKQIDFAQQLYGDAERNARAGYIGTTRRNIAAAPRHYAEVAHDLAEAATQLRAMAGGIRLGGSTPAAIADADRIVTGCGRLIVELRQGQRS